jgi:predicted NBD/HSP70 family sugar kinase
VIAQCNSARQPATERVRQALAQAVSGVLAVVAALVDPALVIVGGSWGSHPAILRGIREAAARLLRRVPIRAAHLTVEPSLTGARLDALTRLRAAIVATPQERRSEAPAPAAG